MTGGALGVKVVFIPVPRFSGKTWAFIGAVVEKVWKSFEAHTHTSGTP